MIKYTEITNQNGIVSILKEEENGKVWSIPIDPANSDYQAYLSKDNPQVGHFAEIVSADEPAALAE